MVRFIPGATLDALDLEYIISSEDTSSGRCGVVPLHKDEVMNYGRPARVNESKEKKGYGDTKNSGLKGATGGSPGRDTKEEEMT